MTTDSDTPVSEFSSVFVFPCVCLKVRHIDSFTFIQEVKLYSTPMPFCFHVLFEVQHSFEKHSIFINTEILKRYENILKCGQELVKEATPHMKSVSFCLIFIIRKMEHSENGKESVSCHSCRKNFRVD
jgi:hypothetical protein